MDMTKLLIAVSAVALTAAAAPPPDEAAPPAQVALYGVYTNVPLISNGFVFVGHQYLDAPYRVTQQGLRIYVNDRLVDQVHALAPPPTVTSPPAVPATLTTNSSIISDELYAYLRELAFYVRQNVPHDQQYEEHIRLIALLPCIQSTNCNLGSARLTIRSYRGEELVIGLQPLGRRGIETVADAQRALRNTREYFERSLQDGNALFICAGGSSRIELPVMMVKDMLPPILLLRNRNIKNVPSQSIVSAQAQSLMEAGLALQENMFPDLLTNFTASSQLDQRIQEMILRAQEDQPEE